MQSYKNYSALHNDNAVAEPLSDRD